MKNDELWDTNFGFYWYNDREIFDFSKRDHDRKAEELAESGINHVITFSCTHFRWSFRRYWPVINDTIADLAEACHRCGIKVTEHHSSHLTFNPLTDDEAYLDAVLTKRKAKRSSWPDLRGDCDSDPIIGSHRLSSFRQIDGRTGEYARTGYRGYAMCFNNPYYRRAYLDYLESVYETGIDGIMTDDVQYFALESWQKTGHACACAHCRELFTGKTGYHLPDPGERWQAWHGDYEDPSFLAWFLFKSSSIENFHEPVADHYESKGLDLLRPNYCSTVLNCNPTSYALETLPRLHWIFQENCFSSLISQSWPSWTVEAGHRSAVSVRREIPAMSMFYPDQDDTVLFSWALAMSWGHLYLATPEGENQPTMEQPLRLFESRHKALLRDSRRVSEIFFYDSRINRLLYKHTEDRSMPALKTWAQACYLQNLQWSMVGGSDLGRLPAGRVLVINDVAFLSDSELASIEGFVAAGGTVVWTGDSGSRRPDGGIRETVNVPAESGTWMPGDKWAGPELRVHNIDRWEGNNSIREVTIPEYQPIHEKIVDFLDRLLPFGRSVIMEAPAGLLCTLYHPKGIDGLVLHVVNAVGVLKSPGTGMVSHGDPIPLTRLDEDIEVRISRRIIPEHSDASKVLLHRPGADEASALEIEKEEETLRVVIPAGKIDRYALVDIRFGP